MIRESRRPDRPSGSRRTRTVVTVGTFDGVHVGHRAVLDRVRRGARRRGWSGLVVTFDPHPLRVLRPEAAPGLLTTTEEKLALLDRLDVDRVEVIRFTEAFAALSPGEFVRNVLMDEFGMEELVIGYNHGFGRGREGSVHVLQTLGIEMGFEVTVVGPVLVDGEKVSSSRIRKCIAAADLDFAALALGRPYSLTAGVVRGEGRGRSLGFPTANLGPPGGDKLIPPPGVYAVRVRIDEESYAGMMHQGERPTFPGSSALMEVHVIDFECDLTGRRLQVEYLERIRGVRRFDGPERLREQLVRDRERSRRIVMERDTLQT
jgi:riboflavin kinase/FMN adenylyltransferase